MGGGNGGVGGAGRCAHFSVVLAGGCGDRARLRDLDDGGRAVALHPRGSGFGAGRGAVGVRLDRGGLRGGRAGVLHCQLDCCRDLAAAGASAPIQRLARHSGRARALCGADRRGGVRDRWCGGCDGDDAGADLITTGDGRVGGWLTFRKVPSVGTRAVGRLRGERTAVVRLDSCLRRNDGKGGRNDGKGGRNGGRGGRGHGRGGGGGGGLRAIRRDTRGKRGYDGGGGGNDEKEERE